MRPAIFLITGWLWLATLTVGDAEEPVRSEATGNVLERYLAEYDRLDQELAAVTEQLTAARGAERRRLETRKRALETAQNDLLDRIEQLIGPLPPAVRPQAPTPAQQQQAAQEQRRETTLDSARDRRLQ